MKLIMKKEIEEIKDLLDAFNTRNQHYDETLWSLMCKELIAEIERLEAQHVSLHKKLARLLHNRIV